MLIQKPSSIRSSEITPQDIYINRRRFIAASTGGLVLAGLNARAQKLENLRKSPLSTAGEKLTPKEDATTYNNFYEFGTAKDEPARNAGKLKTRPWTVSIEGHCNKPKTYDIDSLLKLAPLEERVYRLRCVEAWSMVVPWVGYSLSELLKAVEPNSKAKYVAFETQYDPSTMLPSRSAGISFPYREGLRLDEAMHPLTLLSFGIYGEVLPNQNGAPVRIVVPWKYGFKSIKSIVRVRLVENEPVATWKQSNSREYGFYSNVNPQVDHPRWSQASERRLGEIFRRKTLMFNGYGDQVANLYTGMDLKSQY
ncbi:MAG TPA: protein-methionine-sulfoxide reductase catalytic subunit MsrP [Bryobacteraceae bacterium]|nr:protein-methionine-sulfoxide reductase catalytic subunit MsrP [Bryobacteraceae bacterium]